jgi:hypothetical protein
MKKYNKQISDFKACPKCGSDYGYFQAMYVFGWVEDIKDFDGKHANKGELYDYLNYSRESKFYCCVQCKERIARVNGIGQEI